MTSQQKHQLDQLSVQLRIKRGITEPLPIAEANGLVFTEVKGVTVTVSRSGIISLPAVRSYPETGKPGETAFDAALFADQLFDRQRARDLANPIKASTYRTGHLGARVDTHGMCDSKDCRCKMANGTSGQPKVIALARPGATDRRQASERLALVAETLARLHGDVLEKLKEDARYLGAPDFVWRSLVESFSSWGGSSGYEGLFGNAEKNYNSVRFEALSKLSPSDRLRVLTLTLSAAKIRWSDKKAGFLFENFTRIQEMGGLAAAKTKLLAQPTREAKISFLKQFKGIKDKYARNIFMNVHHPEFLQSIAIDGRIQSISTELGLSFASYEEEEQFYLGVARRASLNGWELDRLIYAFKDEALSGLRGTAPGSHDGRMAAPCRR